ncbi:Retrovirus-related Pol polyprotein from transposon RE1 [Vitis vinifera]|uniref:Retrovirus-related Pol polyprotein from transposon RE1 n=1 Tax=Vitis vinifera TaxID=29760 RepID=A0A438GTX1_VITVI|nr:Retrovirus-related Pol polyprotein from transposon RE1 [Vitis vinifera]
MASGYDLQHFIDGTHTPPPPTVTVTGVASPNLAYTIWKRQDRLIFSALLGAISVSLQPLIARTTTSFDAWQTLANTYAKPSRGHIKQLKEQLKRCTNGSKSISEYMQAIKTRADELALLGKPVDDEDLIDRVLEGLSDEYKSIIDAINAHDTSISFAELHEKLLNKEASLQTAQPSPLPATANPTAFRNRPNLCPPTTTPQQPGPTTAFSPHDQRQPKPYLGCCQACGIQGHTAKRCLMFWLITNQRSTTPCPQGTQGYRPSTPWQPRANHVVLGKNTTLT